MSAAPPKPASLPPPLPPSSLPSFPRTRRTRSVSPIHSSDSASSASSDSGNANDDEDLGAAAEGEGEGAWRGPTVACQWEECGETFGELGPLIEHLHGQHIGHRHSNKYTCEWINCPRKGKNQTSRFALVSHLRSHTGEKPFVCERPECDRSFTRSDALAKHMRVQHGLDPTPTSTRALPTKRRKADSSAHTMAAALASVSAPATSIDDDLLSTLGEPTSVPTPTPTAPAAAAAQEAGSDEDEHGRSNWERYILAKAKHREALRRHEVLLDELEHWRRMERRMRAEKDEGLDRVLVRELGPEESRLYTAPIDPPVGDKSLKPVWKGAPVHQQLGVKPPVAAAIAAAAAPTARLAAGREEMELEEEDELA